MSASPLADELRGIPNPFRSGITRDAWDPDWVDVPEIHAGVSARICEEVAAIRRLGGSRGVLVYGAPGSGKTHLLNRIRRWCLHEGALFSGFRLQCAPQTLWRHLRREFASDLLEPLPDGSRQIERLLAAGEDRIRQQCGFALARVLSHWREARFLPECESWLRGERLPEPVLAEMGIAEGGELEEEAEEEARRILKELIALAAPAPVVLALDQIEAMQSDSQDPRGLKALGSAAAALRDESNNLVLITCVQTSFLPVLEKTLHAADMDRINEVRLELADLDVHQARQLLIARLEAEPALRGHRFRQNQPLWPFTEYALRHILVRGAAIVARRLIYAARDLFEQLRDGKRTGEIRDAGQFLSTEFRRRANQALESTRWEGNEFLLDGLRRLLPLAGWKDVEPRPQGVDLALEKDGRTLLLVMFNQPQMYGAARRLERLHSLEDAARVRLVRAAGLPVGRHAPKTAQAIERLEARGARLVRIPRETLAALEACRTLLADAAAGDLHMDGVDLGREFVEQWLRGNLPAELEELAARLETAREEDRRGDRLADALAEIVRAEKILAVAEAAARLGCGVEEVRRCADQAQDIIAAVGDPPQVLFERCG